VAVLNHEGFELIEQRGSITVEEFAEVFGIKKRSAATWLSKWTNYENKARDIRQQFLVREPRSKGQKVSRYKIGHDWWGERYFSSAKTPLESYRDSHRGADNNRR